VLLVVVVVVVVVVVLLLLLLTTTSPWSFNPSTHPEKCVEFAVVFVVLMATSIPV